MSRPLKLLFDECLTGPLVNHLSGILQYSNVEFETKLLMDFVKKGVRDEDWIPLIQNEGWFVITGDSGRGGAGKGVPLPMVCSQSRVTHVMLSPKLQQKSGFEKVRAIINVWEKICELPVATPGSGWLLRLVGDSRFDLILKSEPNS